MPTEVGHLRSAYWLKTSGVWALHRQISAVFLVANFRASGPKHITTEGGSRMGRRIRVRAIAKEEPDIRLYVLALIALARQLAEEEERQAAEQQQPSASGEEA